MKLETQRLLILPLSQSQLQSYLEPDALENELGLLKNNRIVPQLLTDKIAAILPRMTDRKNNYLFHTFWTIIDKTKNVMVADLCFKGEPNNGEVEIGYGTYEQFQRKGYMAEAVGAIIAWTFENNSVTSIYAGTDPGNQASQKVLLKNHFRLVAVKNDIIEWRRFNSMSENKKTIELIKNGGLFH